MTIDPSDDALEASRSASSSAKRAMVAAIVAASIALVGTLATIFFGYRQSKDEFAWDQRKEAYAQAAIDSRKLNVLEESCFSSTAQASEKTPVKISMLRAQLDVVQTDQSLVELVNGGDVYYTFQNLVKSHEAAVTKCRDWLSASGRPGTSQQDIDEAQADLRAAIDKAYTDSTSYTQKAREDIFD